MDKHKKEKAAEDMAHALSNVNQTGIVVSIDDVREVSEIFDILAKKLDSKQKFAVQLKINPCLNVIVNLTTKGRIDEKLPD